MHPERAKTRRFLAVHSAVSLVFIVPLLVFIVRKWGETTALVLIPASTLALINGTILLWLAVDIAVTHYYLKKIRKYVGHPRMLSFMEIFFVKGASWAFVRQDALLTEKAVQEVLERAKPFPDLDIQDVLEIGGIRYARLLVERAEHEASSAVREAQERERRETKRSREAAELLQCGIALGISKGEMQSLLAENLDRARAVIAKKKRGNELLERAGRFSCTDTIQRLVKNGYLDEAGAMLVKVGALLEKARSAGVEERVRSLIAEDDLPSAERAVTEAEARRAFELMKEAHEQRIAALPEHRRPRAREILNSLDGKRSNVRDFRKALHELEQALAR